MTVLLDANVLIALTVEEHEHHERASHWAAGITNIALCPVVEGALVRFLIRTGETVQAARKILSTLYGSSRCEFWPDSLSYAEADLDGVRGHRQLTDAYLASLARSRPGTRLATMDEGLAEAARDIALLIPERT